MAKKKTNKDYFGLSWIVSLILVIIPITSLVCGIISRVQDKHYVAAIIRFFVGWNIIWICDIVSFVLNGRIMRILNV